MRTTRAFGKRETDDHGSARSRTQISLEAPLPAPLGTVTNLCAGALKAIINPSQIGNRIRLVIVYILLASIFAKSFPRPSILAVLPCDINLAPPQIPLAQGSMLLSSLLHGIIQNLFRAAWHLLGHSITDCYEIALSMFGRK
jgi:hypothetical protein